MSQQHPLPTSHTAGTDPTLTSPDNSTPETTTTSASQTPSKSTSAAPKVFSCVICRSRKVRCDKQSPCSNCRRANVECVFPSADRPPRWARRLDRANGVGAAPVTGDKKVMERLRNLENLVKELSGQLEQANSAAASNSPASSTETHNRDSESQRGTSPPFNTNSNLHKQLGRMVLQDPNRSRYVSSGFWSRINDEIDGLKIHARELVGDASSGSEDEESPYGTFEAQEIERTPAERNAFMFRHNINPSAPDLREFHPLPSQIPFIIDIFQENVNTCIQAVHLPTLNKLIREWRAKGMTGLTPADEALLFAVYYSTVISMEDDEVSTNFGSSKSEISLKYRLGLEYALAKADFLSVPDFTIVQAFVLFLLLVRRQDSPKYVWMMTGLAIRMAQYLGLQRDGEHFDHLTPYEKEMRRRIWWCLIMIDMKSSEDQGVEPTIATGSFDTKIPLNLNDEDIAPDSKVIPVGRIGLTHMTIPRYSFEMGEVVRKMMESKLEEQETLLLAMSKYWETNYTQYLDDTMTVEVFVGVTVTRLMVAKMKLLTHLPSLLSSPSSPDETISEELRMKLLVCAIEIAEYNHALNEEKACRKWQWIYLTYTHWYAIVYIMIEVPRRSWSATIERAWTALQSPWLIPSQMDKGLRIWIPLRKLMEKGRKHRKVELNRLRADLYAAATLDQEDRTFPIPESTSASVQGPSASGFRERWRRMVGLPENFTEIIHAPVDAVATSTQGSDSLNYQTQPTTISNSPYSPHMMNPNLGQMPLNFDINQHISSQSTGGSPANSVQPAITANNSMDPNLKPPFDPNYQGFSTMSEPWLDNSTAETGIIPWLWADGGSSAAPYNDMSRASFDVNMDVDAEVNWFDWLQTANGLDRDASCGRT